MILSLKPRKTFHANLLPFNYNIAIWDLLKTLYVMITFFVSKAANTFNRWVDMDSVGIKELSLHSAQDPVWVDKSDKLYTKYATLPA